MAAQELVFNIQLEDGSLAEARTTDARSAEKWRKLVADPSTRKAVRVRAMPAGDTAGHALADDSLAVSLAYEDDVEGHTMTLRLPSPEEARRLQKRLLITGMLAASIVAGAGAASLAAQQQGLSAPAAAPAISAPLSIDTDKTAPAISAPLSIDMDKTAPGISATSQTVSPAKEAKDARDSQATGTGTSDNQPTNREMTPK